MDFENFKKKLPWTFIFSRIYHELWNSQNKAITAIILIWSPNKTLFPQIHVGKLKNHGDHFWIFEVHDRLLQTREVHGSYVKSSLNHLVFFAVGMLYFILCIFLRFVITYAFVSTEPYGHTSLIQRVSKKPIFIKEKCPAYHTWLQNSLLHNESCIAI